MLCNSLIRDNKNILHFSPISLNVVEILLLLLNVIFMFPADFDVFLKKI